MNALRLTASIVERDALRHTPAGVPVIDFRLHHVSEVVEAGSTRQVEFEAHAVAIGEVSRLVHAAPMGVELGFDGFIARRSKQSKALVLHVTGIHASEQD